MPTGMMAKVCRSRIFANFGVCPRMPRSFAGTETALWRWRDTTKILTSKEIFLGDYEHVNKANVFFFELASGDPGTYVELGNAIEKYMNGKDLKIYPIFTALRLQRNGASGVECPIGFNSYLVGCLTANNITIYRGFDEAFTAFAKDFDLQ